MPPVIVTYPSATKQQVVTKAEINIIQYLYGTDQKVPAIRFARLQYDIGLYDAKQLCEKIFASTFE